MRIHNLEIFEERRKELRNSSTPQEGMLWSKLKHNQLGYKFRRQQSIKGFIVDFYCPKRRLIIEIDGSQHKESKIYDQERTLYLESLSYRVIRFWNSEVNNNIEEVLMSIKEALETTPCPLLD